MIFSSLQYLLFLPVVAFLYWKTRDKARLVLVVIASYIFYMSWLPIYGILLFVMTTLNWALALGLDAAREKNRQSLLKPLMALGVVGNLACLCYYKYANFFLSNLVSAVNSFAGWSESAGLAAIPAMTWTSLDILLPLGISFFVFEFVHYLADVYTGSKPIRSWMEFAAFAAFFPSQIAGPIKRFQDFVVSLRSPQPLTRELFGEGGTLIMQGLFKKVAIADPISGIIASSYMPHAALSAPDAMIASVGFVIQVFCDFSGYTDMGRGSALLLGIRLPENFQLPFLSRDLAEFWRRWHISLSFWLRDYVYLPLGGSRGSFWKNWRNLFITMVACGLWHGAAWHYVLFGALQGMGLIINREWRALLKKMPALNARLSTPVGSIASVFVTLVFVVSTYTLFRAPDVPTWINLMLACISPERQCNLWQPIIKSGVLSMLAVYMGFWILTDVLKQQRGIIDITVSVYPSALRYASWTAALILIIAARPTVAAPFVYFQF
jgi:alginate O-acetyltransferase complex protein AlgI